LKRRTSRAEAYTAALADLPWLQPPHVPAGCVHAYQAYVTLLSEDAPLTRDELARRLHDRGIATRQGTHAVHALDYYAKRYGIGPEDCPRSWRADRATLTLPLFTQMTDDEQADVVDALHEIARG
jgi:dTDP-4-amino-4,6-dideoxygalactose transaminase